MKSVIKGAGYILVHTPDMVLHNGTTQTTERIVNPESEYLKELPLPPPHAPRLLFKRLKSNQKIV